MRNGKEVMLLSLDSARKQVNVVSTRRYLPVYMHDD